MDIFPAVKVSDPRHCGGAGTTMLNNDLMLVKKLFGFLSKQVEHEFCV